MPLTVLRLISDRLPGLLLILAAAIMITGVIIAFVAPSLRDAPPFMTSDLARRAAAIAGNPGAWTWSNGLIMAAGLLTTFGLVPISLRFVRPSRAWGVTALVVFAFGAVFLALDRMINMSVVTWAAQRYPDPTVVTVEGAFRNWPLIEAFHLLAFIAIGLYGAAFVRSGTASAAGWAFAVVGVAGVLLTVAGGAIPAYVFLATAALGAASWQMESSVAGPTGQKVTARRRFGGDESGRDHTRSGR